MPDPDDTEHDFVFDQAGTDDEFVERFRPTAITLAGQATGAEALANIAEAFRTQYRLDASVPSGANAGILELLLSSSKEGTEEQYVAAFVLLAEALGARARIAIGYVLRAGYDVITTEHARAWPEVWSEDAGWVTFDVVPTDIAAAEPEPLTEFDGRAATPPPPLPPPVSTPQEEPPPPTPTSSGRGLLDRILSVAVLVGGSLILVGLLLGGVLGAIILAKRRRRRRRLAAARTSAKVIGAWAEATDSLVDYGARVRAPPHQRRDRPRRHVDRRRRRERLVDVAGPPRQRGRPQSIRSGRDGGDVLDPPARSGRGGHRPAAHGLGAPERSPDGALAAPAHPFARPLSGTSGVRPSRYGPSWSEPGQRDGGPPRDAVAE